MSERAGAGGRAGQAEGGREEGWGGDDGGGNGRDGNDGGGFNPRTQRSSLADLLTG